MADSPRILSRHRDEVGKDRATAFELDRSFRGPLVAYFMKRVNSRNEAEDLTQEVFIRLLNHPDKNNGQDH